MSEPYHEHQVTVITKCSKVGTLVDMPLPCGHQAGPGSPKSTARIERSNGDHKPSQTNPWAVGMRKLDAGFVSDLTVQTASRCR